MTKTLPHIIALLIVSIVTSCNCTDTKSCGISQSLDSASANRDEIQKALDYFPDGSDECKAMRWLIEGMRGRCSYSDSLNAAFRRLCATDTTNNMKELWLAFNSTNHGEPLLQSDLKMLSADYLISNVTDAIGVWKRTPWKDKISFENFCKNILPYNIYNEPAVSWRKYFRDKYSFLIEGITNEEEAFRSVFEYEKNHFTVKSTVMYAYEQDPLLLDIMQNGDCRQRAVHMVYVMRALGIAAALDYTPIWANYGERNHFWAVMLKDDGKVYTGSRNRHDYIEGTYEKSQYRFDASLFTSSIDSLKKISKVFRRTFEEHEQEPLPDKGMVFRCMGDGHSVDVTSQYDYITQNNIVKINAPLFADLYVCTFTQTDGWIPVARARRVGMGKADVGPLIHDNLIIVCAYIDGMIQPVSKPNVITYDSMPEEICPDLNNTETVRLYRKYMLRTLWLNRWGEVEGMRIESSDDRMFAGRVDSLCTITGMPTSEKLNIMLGDIGHDYIRILPAKGLYPTFAELRLIDKKGTVIPKERYKIFSIGEGLTGDTIVTRKLQDDDIMTTFYKRFPFWIGMDVRNVRRDIAALQAVMYNDGNQIIPDHKYELLYFDDDWHSLGEKTAVADFIEFSKVPKGALLLLRDHSGGREERVFMYRDNKQYWY